MKRFLYGMCFTCALLPSVFAQSSLKTEEDKLSYSIGADLGKSFKSQGIKIHSDSFMQGFSTALSGQSLVLSQDEMRETLQNFQKKLLMKRIAQYKEKATINKEKGQKFLEENKTKDGVKTTESGLQYKVLEKGEGKESPTKEDSVTVEYTGKLLDGKVFDTTDGKDKPATFKVTQVIPGWTEVLQLMKPGDKWEVYIPSDLAYGPRGIGGPIGPNETLIFTIKLITVDKDKSAKANDAK